MAEEQPETASVPIEGVTIDCTKTKDKQRSKSVSVEAASNEAWTCKSCKKTFSDDKSAVIECDYCELYTCAKCAKLSSAEYKMLSKHDNIFWTCKSCVSDMKTLLKSKRSTLQSVSLNGDMKQLVKSIDSFMATVTNRLDKHENVHTKTRNDPL